MIHKFTYNIPNEGAIAPGYDADLVLVDLNSYYPVRREDIVSKCGWSPFEGWNLTGWAQTTIVGGQIAYHQRKLFPQVRGNLYSLMAKLSVSPIGETGCKPCTPTIAVWECASYLIIYFCYLL